MCLYLPEAILIPNYENDIVILLSQSHLDLHIGLHYKSINIFDFILICAEKASVW